MGGIDSPHGMLGGGSPLRSDSYMEPQRVGREPYDPVREFERQGVLRPRARAGSGGMMAAGGEGATVPSPWRLSGANDGYRLCHSYPTRLVVPAECDDEMLRDVAAFRSEGRLPTLSWGRRDSAASIWRSSQPKVGVSGASSPADERMLAAIARAAVSAAGGGAASSALDTAAASANAAAAAGGGGAGGSTAGGAGGICHIVDCRPRSNATANKLTGHG